MPEAAAPTQTEAWCLFHCGARACAVRLESVAEVIWVERLTRFPLAPPQVLGLCTLRRDVIPVILLDDAERSLRHSPDGKLVVLVLQTRHGLWGLTINREGIVVTEEAALVGGDDDGVLTLGSGRVRCGESSHEVLDPEEIWRGVRASVESRYRPEMSAVSPN